MRLRRWCPCAVLRGVLVGTPVTAREPRARAHACDGSLHALRQRRRGTDIEQVRANEQRARLVEVRVVVDEAGRQETTARVDHTRSRRAVRVGLGVRADDNETLATNRDRLCARFERVAGPDAGVANDDVGFLRLRHARQRYRTRQREDRRANRWHTDPWVVPRTWWRGYPQ